MTRKNEPLGLAAFDGKDLVGYAEVSAATGLAKRTLRTYQTQGKMPKSRRGVWAADDPELIAFVTLYASFGSKGRRGFRSDLHGRKSY